MTEFELTQLIYSANEAGNTAIAIYLTIVSGYLIAAYSVGGSLNKLQITVVNSLFLFFSCAYTYSTFVSFRGMRIYADKAAAMGREAATTSSAEDIVITVLLVAQVIGITAAFAFMWDVRRRLARGPS